MGKIRELIGRIKDRASQSKAALVSNPKTLPFHLSLLRATTHDPSAPPAPRHVDAILSAGKGSRATAAAAVEAVMDRLHTTGDASVALKCLVIVHHILEHGGFILQDQLSVFPAAGGRNYLKLSGFRDEKSPLMWELSYWVRWYALYLEHLLSSSRILGFFLSSTSNTCHHRDEEDEKVSSLSNSDILRDIDALVCLLEEVCRIPDLTFSQGKNLADKITQLVGQDYASSISELFARINEFKQRSSYMCFGESVELVCALKRLESCRERLSEICRGKRLLVDGFWDLVKEVKGMVGNFGMNDGQNGKMIVRVGERGLGSESARFGDRLVSGCGDSVRFSSGRFSTVDRFDFPVFASLHRL